MLRITGRLLSAALVACALWPVTASAQTDPPTLPLMTVDQVRGAFVAGGYSVDQVHAWDWMRPPVTSFEVHGQNDGRVLMVLVYPSTTAALSARLIAESHEQAMNAGQPADTTTGHGPHLVSGFGASEWDGNVALVQTTERQLERLYAEQADGDMRDGGGPGDVDDTTRPRIAVDADFFEALQGSAVNL